MGGGGGGDRMTGPITPPSQPKERTAELPPHMRAGTIIGGRYEVVRPLGAGAMGVVLVVKTSDGRHLALKVLQQLSSSLDGEEGLQRFLREARVSSSINSPHVVPVVDSGFDPITSAPFLVMTLLHGGDLAMCLEKVRCLHPTVAVRIVCQAAKGLKAAHVAGVIHRDVKPQNLFLTQSAVGDVVVKVCDFGIAKPATPVQALTSSGSMLGTPLYMAPEQLQDSKTVDPRVDVWSLAMTLYEALAGEPAHGGARNLSELVVGLIQGDTPPLQDRAPWVDPALATVVHGALLRELSARCPSMAAFADALAPFACGTDRLHADMLQPVPDELRRTRAPRAKLPTQWAKVKPSLPPPDAPSVEAVATVEPPSATHRMDAQAMLALADTVGVPQDGGAAVVERQSAPVATHPAAKKPISAVAMVSLAVLVAVVGLVVGLVLWFW